MKMNKKLFILFVLAPLQVAIAHATFLEHYTIADLTHEVHSEIPTWDLTCGFYIKTMRDYHHCDGEFKIRSQSIDIRASAGTHMDAPSHFVPGAININNIPLEQLIAPCVVIDVSHQINERYRISVADIQDFEKKYGTIKPGSFVLFYTGWSRFWDNPKKYHNNHVFPSVATAAAKYLLEKQIVGIGIDTLSPDCFEQDSYVHTTILGANKYIVENIAHADQLPPVGTTICVMPLKIGTAESPVRLVGLIPK